MTVQSLKTFVLDLLQQGYSDEEAFWQERSEAERTAIGTQELWSVKAHMAHRLFWHRDLIDKLTAALQHQEVSSSEESDDQINAKVFEEHRLSSWTTLHSETKRADAEMIALIERLSEEDLTDPERFPAITGGHPLYTAFLGSCYEHDQEHLAQYYYEHHDLPRAIQIRERCASRILQADVPAWVKGWFIYNLAGFYAQQNQLEKAGTYLQEAVNLDPRLQERSQNDPELMALRERSA